MAQREILFRGWFEQFNGQEFWVYGHYYMSANGNSNITDGHIHWTVDADSVSQYIGKRDKFGNMIFDRDIVMDNLNELHIVSWMKESAGWFPFASEYQSIRDSVRDCVSRGNAYQHPELLIQLEKK